ncbi:MAG: ATP-binding cassette domain-containing protein [Deltaproteobacteria bacterium]|nr:ATP-binding cassette domain-containing protein [Deltaproteobacteria bacterium]
MEFLVDPMVIMAGLIILYFSAEVFHMSLAKTGMFVFVLLRLMPYTKDIFNSRQVLAGFSGSLFRVTEYFQKAREAHTIDGGKVSSISLDKGIRFENVTFSYVPEETSVLKDINLFIPAGKMTALVGRSGAGKSTLVDLIPRLRVPTKGRIYFDDEPVENYDLRALRRSIAFVSQEGFLFNDTIERNIRYGRPEASPEEVTRAARMAHAHHFIKEMPEEYETVVGERGIKLSGGQRTSSLDSESEEYIQKAMEEIRKKEKITLIIIAHRLATIRSADQIIVIDNGMIAETGNHKNLIKQASWYAHMVKMQTIS